MTDPKLDEVRSWLYKARQDLDASAWLLESPRLLYGVVVFHCQQAAEKTLKAYLTWQDQPFEKTHSLVALVGMCMKFNGDFTKLRTPATILTPFAISARYPGELPDVSNQEALDALALARGVWDFVHSLLPKEAQLP